MREGRRAVEVLPPSKDSINDAHIANLLAVIYAWVGEKDLATDQLSRTVQIPGGATVRRITIVSTWDRLRGDPRFEEIVEPLAPKL